MMLINDERGVSMVEVLVTIAISGLLMTVLAATIVTGLRTTDDTRERVEESHDVNMVTTWFTSDVQTAGSVSTSDGSCGGAPIVHLTWSDLGTVTEVTYRARTVDGERVLTRYACVDGGSPTARDVVRNVDDAADPVLTCSPACSGSPKTLTLEVALDGGGTVEVTAARRRG